MGTGALGIGAHRPRLEASATVSRPAAALAAARCAMPICGSCPTRPNASAPAATPMGCAPAKSQSNCRRGRMRRSIISAASARLGSGAKTARRTRAARMKSAPSNSIRAGPKASQGSRPSRMCCCSIGWIRRGAISCCNGRAITPSIAALLPCARRRGPIRSRCRWRGFSRIDGNKLSVVGIDCLDDTPLLDIKPYFASTDSVPDAVVGWHADRQ